MRLLLILLIFPWMLQAHTLEELFHALTSQAVTKVDEMSVRQAQASKSKIESKLYPTLNLVGTYDNYSTPTAMLPLAPNELFKLVPNNETQPFSYNIYRGGVRVSMPIFIKSLYTLADQAKMMQASASAKKRINMLQNEAVIVSSNANLIYLAALKKALIANEHSLQKTEQIVQLKVKNGRSPASNLYNIDDGINQIKIKLNDIDIQKQRVISQIEALTGIRLLHFVDMTQKGTYHVNRFGSLEPLQKKVQAQRLDLKAKKEALYPTVIAHGSYMYQYGAAYNTKQGVYNQYGDVGVVINIPIVTMSGYADIKQAKVQLLSSQYKLDVLRNDLESKAVRLQSSLSLLDNSIKLDKKSINNKKRLLKIARTSYLNGRMSVIDYLKYEDDIVAAKAALYQAQAKKTATVMQLAVIYANNIEEIMQ